MTTLTSQYIKFILETQRRLEEEEVNTPKRFRQSPTNIDSFDLTYLLTDVWENNLSFSTLDTDLTLKILQIVNGLESVQW